MFKINKFKELIPWFLLAVAVILAYYAISEIGFIFSSIAGILSKIWGVIRPFFYGFIMAYILHIPFDGMQKLMDKSKFKFIRERKKAISLVLIIIILMLIMFAISALIIPAIYDSLFLFIENLPRYWQEAQSWLEELNHTLNNWGIDLDEIFQATPETDPDLELLPEDDIAEEIDNIDIAEEIIDDENAEEVAAPQSSGFNISIDTIIPMLEDWLYEFNFESLSTALFGVGTAIVGVGSAMFTGFLIFISSIYFLIDKEKIKYFLCRLLVIFTPSKFHDIIIEYGGKFDKNCKQYIKTQTVVSLILGVIIVIQLLILRSPFALVLGVMLFIANYIPYFGSIFGSIIAIIIIAFTQGIFVAAIASILILIAQQVVANVIQPKLFSSSFSISPLLVIIGIIFGQAIAGVFGMIVAIPIIAVLKDIFEDVIKRFEQKKLGKNLE